MMMMMMTMIDDDDDYWMIMTFLSILPFKKNKKNEEGAAREYDQYQHMQFPIIETRHFLFL